MGKVMNPDLLRRGGAGASKPPPPPNPPRSNVAAVREASQLNQLRRLTSLEREKMQTKGFKALPLPGMLTRQRGGRIRRISWEGGREGGGEV